jgi:hypothetical protein
MLCKIDLHMKSASAFPQRQGCDGVLTPAWNANEPDQLVSGNAF